jgi:hypothetical protein
MTICVAKISTYVKQLNLHVRVRKRDQEVSLDETRRRLGASARSAALPALVTCCIIVITLPQSQACQAQKTWIVFLPNPRLKTIV